VILRSITFSATRFGIVLALLVSTHHAAADYPIMSHRYLADPGSLVYEGRVYLYNSNDDDNNGSYQMHTIVCVSTADMKNWTDHGIVFQVPANASWANNSWAPQPIVRDGTIYLYFGNSGTGIGVASSTSPTGGFKDAKGSYLINSSTSGASGTDSWLFDPGALIDDDGQAYLSFGGNGINNGRIIKLGSNLTSVTGSATPVSTTSFYEASFLFKRNKKYYFAYSTNSENELRIDYHWSDSPMSGYTYGGIIAGQPPSNNNNNHASQFLYKDQWYHAYHNRYVATQAGIDTTYKRNLALEVLNFGSDGKIEQVKYTTDGVPQIGSLDPYVRVEAETMNAQSGIETETCSEGGMDVTQIANGDWIRLRGVDFGTAGATSFTARVAAAAAGGSIELRLGSATGTLIGTCSVPATGGTQTWANTTCSVSGATGVKDLYLKFAGSGTFNLNYWQFSNGGESTGAGGSSGAAGASGNGGSGVTTGGTRANTAASAGATSAAAAGGTGSSAGGATASDRGGARATAGGATGNGGKSSGSNTMSGGTTTTGDTTAAASLGGAVAAQGGITSTSRAASGGVASAQGGTANTRSAALGGSSASGNALATGAAPSSLSTTGTASTSAGSSSASGDANGCGCRYASKRSNSSSQALVVVLGLLAMGMRRRARR
jgi:arabinoxylan arabinofuranohydrolase